MAAGLEGDVGGCAVDAVPVSGGLLQGDDLGVVAVVVEMCAFAKNDVAVREDAADRADWARREQQLLPRDAGRGE